MTQDTRIAIGGSVTSVTPLPLSRTHVTAVTHSPNRRARDERHTGALDKDYYRYARLRVSGQPHRQDNGGIT